jgi:hypothetical protein
LSHKSDSRSKPRASRIRKDATSRYDRAISSQRLALPGRRRAWLATVLDLLILVVSAAALFTFVTDGIRFHVGSFRISMRDPVRLGLAVLPLIAIRFVTWRGAPLPAFARGYRSLLAITPHLLVTFIFLNSVAQFYKPGTGFTSMLVIGSRFDRHAPAAIRNVPREIVEGVGYDGQFYAQIATDPLLRDSDALQRSVDFLGFRARRVFFPAIAYVIGFGDTGRILQAYALLNVFAWLLLALLLLRWLPPGSIRPTLAWAACLLTHGMLASVNQALLDGPSMLLIAAAVVAIERHRPWLATAFLGVGGVARETNLLSGSLLLPARKHLGSVTRAVLQAALIVAPLALWLLYLDRLELSPFVSQRETFSPPLVSFVGKWRATIGELRAEAWQGSLARLSLLSLVAMTTQAVVLLCWYRWYAHPWWRVGIVYVGLMAVLGPTIWAGYPGAFVRILLPVTFAFNILLPASRWFWPLLVLGNANILQGIQGMAVPWLQ